MLVYEWNLRSQLTLQIVKKKQPRTTQKLYSLPYQLYHQLAQSANREENPKPRTTQITDCRTALAQLCKSWRKPATNNTEKEEVRLVRVSHYVQRTSTILYANRWRKGSHEFAQGWLARVTVWYISFYYLFYLFFGFCNVQGHRAHVPHWDWICLRQSANAIFKSAFKMQLHLIGRAFAISIDALTRST